MSKREQKRVVSAGVRALRNKPGWDPTAAARPSAEDQLATAQSEVRTERAYDDSAQCAACSQARAELGDDTALCDDHMAEALGLGKVFER